MKRTSLLVPTALLALGAGASAQTLLVLDGPQATVREVSGPSDPLFCFYPDGPVKSQFSTNQPFACPLPGRLPPLPELRGDVTVDRPRDLVWATDGLRIAAYDASGLPVNAFDAPLGLLSGPVLGMGFNGAQGTLWITDGQHAVELLPPTIACGTPSVVTPPFNIPPVGGSLAAVTDLDWSPATNTLWVCNAAGAVGNVLPGGALLSSFQATPGPCGFLPALLGIAVDGSVTGAGVLHLTDGVRIGAVDPSGASAAGTFGQPLACFSVPGGSAFGLGFSSRAVSFGSGTGLELGSFGQSVIPSTTLGVTLKSAPSGSLAILPFSLAPLCPALPVSGEPILIFPSAFALFTLGVSVAGEASVPIAIPATTAVGLEVFYQWFVLTGGPAPADGSPLLSSGAGSMRTGFR